MIAIIIAAESVPSTHAHAQCTHELQYIQIDDFIVLKRQTSAYSILCTNIYYSANLQLSAQPYACILSLNMNIFMNFIKMLTRRFDWCWRIHDSLATRRNFPDTLFCMPTISILFQVIVYHGPRNRLRIGNLIGVESIRIQIDVINRNTVRGYHLHIQIEKKSTLLPRIRVNANRRWEIVRVN